MKKSMLLSLCLIAFFVASAQKPEQETVAFNNKKGWGIYAIVRPMWYNQTALNQRLNAANLPEVSKFNWQLGLGISYLFETGTELGLDVTSSSQNKNSNQSSLTAMPLAYDFVVRQNLASIARDFHLYAMAGGFGFEQLISIERQSPAVNQFQQALLTSNVSRISLATEGFVFGFGLKNIDLDKKQNHLAEYWALEIGYRLQLGKTWWSNTFYDISNGPEADVRQFYLSMKFGAFLKAKQKSKKER
jgi:hypothetical protein